MTDTDSAPSVPAGRPPLPEGLYCLRCGYDLRGLTGDRCPECGFDLADVRSSESLIPWIHRRQLGPLRAYWRTVWLVSRRPRQLATEMARPVSYSDARRFGWLTLAHAYLPILGSVLLLHVWSNLGGRGGGYLSLSTLVACLIGVLAWLAAGPAVAAYWFSGQGLTPEQEDRACALAHYTAAPAALSAAGLPLAVAAAATWDPYGLVHPLLVSIMVGGWFILLSSVSGARTELAKRVLHQRGWQRALRLLVANLAGIGLVLLALLLLAGFRYALIMWRSLR